MLTCPSQTGVFFKMAKCMITHNSGGNYGFLTPEILMKFEWSHPQRGGGQIQMGSFRPISHCSSETVQDRYIISMEGLYEPVCF